MRVATGSQVFTSFALAHRHHCAAPFHNIREHSKELPIRGRAHCRGRWTVVIRDFGERRHGQFSIIRGYPRKQKPARALRRAGFHVTAGCAGAVIYLGVCCSVSTTKSCLIGSNRAGFGLRRAMSSFDNIDARGLLGRSKAFFQALRVHDGIALQRNAVHFKRGISRRNRQLMCPHNAQTGFSEWG